MKHFLKIIIKFFLHNKILSSEKIDYNFGFDIIKNERQRIFRHKSLSKNRFFKKQYEYVVVNEIYPTLIIPIYNAYEDFVICLNSIFKYTTCNVNIILINDCSTDLRISPLLEKLRGIKNISIIYNDSNLGYTKSINLGISLCKTDVILLNSDTIVSPKWIENLTNCAYSDKKIGTVTPLSDNAGAFSIFQEEESCRFPWWATRSGIARAVSSISMQSYTKVNTGNGFCMYIKRRLLNNIGLFDAKSFPIGYGEENDFCMRAYRRGWSNAIDESTIIYHKRTASFKGRKASLVSASRIKINQLHPDYKLLTNKYFNSKELSLAKKRIKDLFSDFNNLKHFSQKTILYVLHESTGGTPATSLDLASNLKEYRVLFLTSNRKSMFLKSFYKGKMHLLKSWAFKRKLYPTDISSKEYTRITKDILINYNVDIVHIRHLIFHTFDLPKIARRLNIPVVLSFHDFYFICPTIHLLDEKKEYCKGNCTATTGECPQPYDFSKRIINLKHKWIKKWRVEVNEMLTFVDCFVTTSNYSKNRYCKIYPTLLDKNFHVIPHGRDFSPKRLQESITKKTDRKIKILCPGNLAYFKGTSFISDLMEKDHEKRIEVHTLGNLSKEARSMLKGKTIDHGSYSREEFDLKVAKIKPDFVGVFSIWPETYCHVMTESWASGIPILANKIGTIAERIKEKGGGWLVDCRNTESVIKKIYSLVNNDSEYSKHKELSNLSGIKSLYKMAFDYNSIYQKCFFSKLKFKKIITNASIQNLKFLKIGVIGNNLNASYFLRIHNNIFNKSLNYLTTKLIIQPEDFIKYSKNYNFDLILVQRNSINSKIYSDFIATAKKRNIKVVFEIDDDLLSLENEKLKDGKLSILFFLKNADLTITTNFYLRENLKLYAKRVNCVPNYLNNDLWNFNSKFHISRRSIKNLLYMGTKTHLEDLRLIIDSLENLYSSTKFRLYLVGITQEKLNYKFIKTLRIPNAWKPYPYFVKWIYGQRLNFDIGIAPLCENNLNKSKSNLKYLEYTALGIPGIYSDIQPYRSVIKDQFNGILVGNKEMEWENKLKLLIEDDSLRKNIIKNANHEVKENFLLKNNSFNYYNTLLSI